MPNVDKDKIIFVVGNSRSGTTLMGNVLGNGPDIFTFEELHFFDHVIASDSPTSELSVDRALAIATQLSSYQASDWLTPEDPQLFLEEAKEIVAEAQATGLTPASVFQQFLSYKSCQSGKTIACEQTPQNVFHLQELLTLYPQSYVINMVRDPRDVLLSQKNKWKIRFLGASNIPLSEALRAWSNYHSAVTSKLWNAAVHAAEKFQDHPRVKTVRFEDLVKDADAVVQAVCEFTQSPFYPEMMNISQAEGGVSSHKKISKSGARGIDPGVASRWKKGGLLGAEVHVCQSIAAKNMEKHDYPIEPIDTLSKYLSVLLFIFLPFKLSLALLLNLNRIGNLSEAIKRRL